MVSISELLEQHDKEKEEPPKLTKKEKLKLKKLKKKLEREAKIRKVQEDEMTREMQVAKKNISVFRSKWKEIQMEKGRPEYKDYMMEHWSLFDHIMDKKDELIEIYCDELEHADRTRRQAQVDDIYIKDQLLLDFYDVLEKMKEGMYNSKEELLKNHNTLVQQFQAESSQNEENMRLIAYLMDQNKKRDVQTWSSEFITKVDEEVSKDRSDRELLIARTEVRMMALWKEYKADLEAYKVYSQSILKRSEPLMEKVKADDQMIVEQKDKLTAMLATIDIAKDRVRKEPMSTALRDLRNERTTLYNQYTEQKRRLADLQRQHNVRIQEQISACLEATEYLNSIMKQGEDIFKYYELTKKFETLQEQTCSVQNELTYSRTTHILGDLPVRTKMIKFWKRVGRAEMVTTLMDVSRTKLINERNSLQKRIETLLRSPELQGVLKDFATCSNYIHKTTD